MLTITRRTVSNLSDPIRRHAARLAISKRLIIVFEIECGREKAIIRARWSDRPLVTWYPDVMRYVCHESTRQGRGGLIQAVWIADEEQFGVAVEPTAN